jgi:hypothetical protein
MAAGCDDSCIAHAQWLCVTKTLSRGAKESGVPEQGEKRMADVARGQEDDPRRFLAISDKENDDDYFFADCAAGPD